MTETKKKTNPDSAISSNPAYEAALNELQTRYPNTLWLTAKQFVEVFELSSVHSVHNKTRKKALKEDKNPLPVKPKKICGKWRFSIYKAAEAMAE